VWVLFYGDVDSGPDDLDAPRPLAALEPEARGRSSGAVVGIEGHGEEEKLLLEAVAEVAEVADEDGDLDPRRRKRVRGARAGKTERSEAGPDSFHKGGA
jgi:hypothetical protein